MHMEDVGHFDKFRENTIQFDGSLFGASSGGIYADWTAAGRLYRPIEERLVTLGSVLGNTHTSDSSAGAYSSAALETAREVIAHAVNAGPDDVVLFQGNGMTGAINWLQQSMGLHGRASLPLRDTPIVIVTGLEHHSNQISWRENGAEVWAIDMDAHGLPDLNHLQKLCRKAHDTGRPLIGSFSAASNVTGVRTPIHEMARIVHCYGGRVIADFAASAPYDRIDMHPAHYGDSMYELDAVVYSPHKFLGGPGSPGVIIFNQSFYAPDQKPVIVGGGIVNWVNRQGECSIVNDVVEREGAGSPNVLGAVRVALASKLKDEMDPDKIHAREDHLVRLAIDELHQIPNLTVLEDHNLNRVGIVSFVIKDLDYALIVRLLSDKFGIQARGGCSCAGPYGHYLFNISEELSASIRAQIDAGDASQKPGWVRLSFHPTMHDSEVFRITGAISEIAEHYSRFKSEYTFDPSNHSWSPVQASPSMKTLVAPLFMTSLVGQSNVI